MAKKVQVTLVTTSTVAKRRDVVCTRRLVLRDRPLQGDAAKLRDALSSYVANARRAGRVRGWPVLAVRAGDGAG